MIIEARDRRTGELVGVRCQCHGCGRRSPWVRGPLARLMSAMPVQHGRSWVVRTEAHYTDKGHLVGGKFVDNHYCPGCVAAGMSARVVATVLRKLALFAARAKRTTRARY